MADVAAAPITITAARTDTSQTPDWGESAQRQRTPVRTQPTFRSASAFFDQSFYSNCNELRERRARLPWHGCRGSLQKSHCAILVRAHVHLVVDVRAAGLFGGEQRDHDPRKERQRHGNQCGVL